MEGHAPDIKYKQVMPCVVVVGPGIQECLDQVPAQGLFEIRVDLLAPETQQQLLTGALLLPYDRAIVTYRSSAHGGKGTFLAQMLLKLAMFQPQWLDVDWEYDASVIYNIRTIAPQTTLIRSWHGASGQPPSALDHTPIGDLWKICPATPTVSEWLLWEDWFQSGVYPKDRLIYLPQGPWGQLQRVWPQRWNLPWVYLPQAVFADGQISYKEYQHVYHQPHLQEHSLLYALIGHPVTKSVGHIIHNRWMSAINYPGRYVRLPLETTQLLHVWPWLKRSMSGLAVTTPLKQKLVPLLDQLHEHAQASGAVNSIKIIDGYAVGENFDGLAAARAITSIINPADRRVLVLGNGATARACACAMQPIAAEVIMLSRNPKTGFSRYSLEEHSLAMWPQLLQESCIVIQATTCGFDNQLLPCDPALLDGQLVLEVVQGSTPFAKGAAARGCSIIPGREMFVHLSAMQAAWWSGGNISAASAETLIREALQGS